MTASLSILWIPRASSKLSDDDVAEYVEGPVMPYLHDEFRFDPAWAFEPAARVISFWGDVITKRRARRDEPGINEFRHSVEGLLAHGIAMARVRYQWLNQ